MRGICAFILVCAAPAAATVFINEVAINPPGSLDDFREFVELCGTPGKKLDGYALALLAGSEQKYYTLNSIPPLPNPKPEIDEFFSLDGLALGPNGLLVLAIAALDEYPESLPDTHFVGPWIDLWNGALDVPGKFENDGSNTIVLIRNRPGRTESNPIGALRWGKGIAHDFELIRPAFDPQDGGTKDQWGDGDLDEGQFNGLNGSTADMNGSTTATVEDDLEIVDEVSYESERGWEYDLDDRHVDIGSNRAGLPERRVHALDDPQGFNPDCLTRVDYRTTGAGWNPVSGATGEMANGKNWQDAATEQWIRGENVVSFTPNGSEIFYDNSLNGNPDSIQPYNTNVPRWLNDGAGTNYNFAATNTYRIAAGRTNPLAVPFIPGDADRNGICDAADIAKIASVFGDDDWYFSNAFSDAEMGDEGDPAEQVRPWDVDATGDNGIEPSDLQWTLNFQGNTDGKIVGRTYDSTTPSTNGVYLNSNAGVGCTVSAAATSPSGDSLADLRVLDQVELIVSARVTSGARTSPANQTNGIMQFVHDLAIFPSGIVQIESVEAIAPFALTREEIIEPQGPFGSAGLTSINGYTTGFSAGLSSPVPMYKVTLQAISLGAASLSIAPAVAEKFAASTPHGLKVGRTNNHGDPGSAVYPPGIQINVTQLPILQGNCDTDPEIELSDYRCLSLCMNGPAAEKDAECGTFDLDGDGDVDFGDAAEFMNYFGN